MATLLPVNSLKTEFKAVGLSPGSRVHVKPLSIGMVGQPTASAQISALHCYFYWAKCGELLWEIRGKYVSCGVDGELLLAPCRAYFGVVLRWHAGPLQHST